MATETSEVLVTAAGGIAILTLNRPHKLNAYTPDMGELLVAAMRRLLRDGTVRALVLTGAGRGFCAGADREFLDGRRADCGHLLGEEPFITEFAMELAQADKPLVAAVNGVATGIGATMLLPFDVRIAAQGASFCFPFAKLGIVPGLGSSYFLPRLIGAAKARELILTAAPLDVTQALAAGLVSEVVDGESLMQRALAIAEAMSAHPPGVVAACKRVLLAGEHGPLSAAMACERSEGVALRMRAS